MKIAGTTSLDDLLRICPRLCRQSSTKFGDGQTRVVQVGSVRFGGERPVVIAGPCAVEHRDQTMEVAKGVKTAGADMLRGGAFKPRTSPHDFQGLGVQGLDVLAFVREATSLPVVTEVMDVRLVDTVAEYADMLQVGSRNMQNYPLLKEVGRARKPVLLKRGMAASLCEWLGAAEYIAEEGNYDIVLCERGIKAYPSGEYSRYVLDLNVIPAVKLHTFLPIIVDPSHATGVAVMVEPASRAAVEFGSHGLIIEVAADGLGERQPLCDAAQAIDPPTLKRIVDFVRGRDGAFVEPAHPLTTVACA